MKPLSLSPDFLQDVISLVCPTSMGKALIQSATPNLFESDCYGPNGHRTWAFYLEDTGNSPGKIYSVGSLERYWGGVKMICSVMGAPPRTYFFTEEGQRASAALLKTLGQTKEKEEARNGDQQEAHF